MRLYAALTLMMSTGFGLILSGSGGAYSGEPPEPDAFFLALDLGDLRNAIVLFT